MPEYADHRDVREFLWRTCRIVYLVRDYAIEVPTIFEDRRLFPTGVLPEDEHR